MELRRRHKKSHRSSGRRRSEERGIEWFLTSSLFKVLGLVFLLIGVYYSFSSLDASNGSASMFLNFFSPSDNAIHSTGNGVGSFSMILLYFLPVLVLLSSTAIFEKRFSVYTSPLSIIVAIYLIVIQSKIILYDNVVGNGVYSSLLVADLCLLITILLLLVNVILNRKPILLIITCLYFYLSIILFTRFGWELTWLFPFVLLFSLGIGYIAQKIEKPFITLLNFIFAIGFFVIFWLRRMVLRDSPELLTEFFIYGALFYIVFYVTLIYAATAKEKPMSRWMQGVMGWTNLLFYAGTTSFVIVHYSAFGYLWIMVLGLLLINILGLYLLEKYHSPAWELPHHFTCMMLMALILPLVLQQNIIILFSAGLSIVMLIYANRYKNSAAGIISIGAIGVSLATYAYKWVFLYLPSILFDINVPGSGMLWNGIIGGFMVVAALGVMLRILKDSDFIIARKWFKRRTYNHTIQGMMLASLFLSMGWIGFALLCWFTGTVSYYPVGLFITGSLFFIGLINFYSGEQSTFKKPLIYLGFSFTLLFPVLVYWNMTSTVDHILQVGDLNGVAFVLHYLAMGLVIVLGAMTVRRIYKLNSKYVLIQRGLETLTVLFVLFLLCTEYDNLSVLILAMQNTSLHNGIGTGVLDANQYLPYSVLMWALAVFVFVRALFYNNRFLRGLAIIIYIIVLVKLFAFDFETLGTTTRSILFFVVGLFLIGFSFLYPRLLKADAKLRKEKLEAQISE